MFKKAWGNLESNLIANLSCMRNDSINILDPSPVPPTPLCRCSCILLGLCVQDVCERMHEVVIAADCLEHSPTPSWWAMLAPLDHHTWREQKRIIGQPIPDVTEAHKSAPRAFSLLHFPAWRNSRERSPFQEKGHSFSMSNGIPSQNPACNGDTVQALKVDRYTHRYLEHNPRKAL